MKLDEFFDEVPLVETIWWDLADGREYIGSPTGTVQGVVQRTVTRAYPKKVHKNCGGDVEQVNSITVRKRGRIMVYIDDCDEGCIKYRCLKCGATECIEF